MRALVAVATAGMVAVSGAAALGVATSPAARADTAGIARPAAAIAWGACESAALTGVGAECGFVPVPLDWSKPNGQKIEIAVSRLRATEQRQGVLLINPGGPGGSGLEFPAIYPERVPDGVGRQYDWIGFDPRGVGSSKPAVSCDASFFQGPRPAYEPADLTKVTGNEAAWVARTKQYAQACADQNGEILSHMRSMDTVRDMDAIRQALGEQQINYYGISYGTFLGQAYASTFPDRVRRMVLDSNVPPDYPGYGDAGRGQIEGFEYTAGEFFRWVAAHSVQYNLGTTAEAVAEAYYARLAELRKAPVGTIGSAEWQDVFLVTGYAESLWPTLADGWALWETGDRARMEFLYEVLSSVGDDNSFAAFNSTLCTDGRWPRNYTKMRNDAITLAKEFRFGTWGSFWFSGPCAFWPVKSAKPPVVDGSKISVPILLLNATQDAPTPFANALRVRQEFPTSVLISDVGGMTHGVGLNGNACVTKYVTDYLRDGTLPARASGNGPDAECARKPLPEPSLLFRGQAAGAFLDGFAPEPLNSLLLQIPVAHRR
ncbi:alpha/beta hydrolase [Sporichthya polymorpha]|uniref:alpha/beta hydrolase n=1 Tax=Sporichthya polymorpha TaxID=35751 RepID=UPI000373998A|nr:alpha/beta hydrolase [Sporichthya polymorpha]